jgi:diguanylate cyclase (GGDEF)-like protein
MEEKTEHTDSHPIKEHEGKQPYLIVIAGRDLGQYFLLEKGRTIVGRDDDANISIHDRNISRKHACFEATTSGVRVIDLDSTNGTYLNNVKVKEADLEDGDLIAIGKCVFKFVYQKGVEQAYQDEIFKSATSDPLTEIPNRRYFFRTLGSEILRSRRYQKPLSLLEIDIDHFKEVNDKYGHSFGDFILKSLAGILQGVTRKKIDLVGRYGGEEFVLMLPETNKANAYKLAEKLRKLVEEYVFDDKKNQAKLTISIGVGTFDPECSSAEELFNRADKALYEAKQAGRNCVK